MESMSKNTTPSCEQRGDGHDFRVVGVDVSKKHGHELPGGPRRGWGLGAWVRPGVRWVVYESTGSSGHGAGARCRG